MTFQEINLIHMIASAGLMVKFVLLLLLFFSITSWAIILTKYQNIKAAFKESVLFSDFFWKSKDLSDSFARAKQLEKSPVARIFRIAYVELKRLSQPDIEMETQPDRSFASESLFLRDQFIGTDNLNRALQRATNTEITRLTRRISFLATTGNTAPFIGLFGTVWGIMSSFHGIGLRGSASLAIVAPGISEALIATAAGLAVAIPAVIAFNYFMHKIRIIESELQNFSADFLNIIERDIMRVKENSK